MESAAGKTDYPFASSQAVAMLAEAMAKPDAPSQRKLAEQMGYRAAVVISHMLSGRAPIPVDRSEELARLLGIPADAFVRAVLQQRHPEIDFDRLFGEKPDLDDKAALRDLEALAGGRLQALAPNRLRILQEVLSDVAPERRWITLTETRLIEAIRRHGVDLEQMPIGGVRDYLATVVAALDRSSGEEERPYDALWGKF